MGALPRLLASPFLLRILRFGITGVLAFGVDAGVFQLLHALAGLAPLAARPLSILTAMTVSWAVNRRFTFASTDPRLLRQWLGFCLANSLGALVNYGTFAALLTLVPTLPKLAALAVASLAGMAFNFAGSNWWVFRRPRPPQGEIDPPAAGQKAR